MKTKRLCKHAWRVFADAAVSGFSFYFFVVSMVDRLVVPTVITLVICGAYSFFLGQDISKWRICYQTRVKNLEKQADLDEMLKALRSGDMSAYDQAQARLRSNGVEVEIITMGFDE